MRIDPQISVEAFRRPVASFDRPTVSFADYLQGDNPQSGQSASQAAAFGAPGLFGETASTPSLAIAHAALPPQSQPASPRALTTQDESGPEIQDASAVAPTANAASTPSLAHAALPPQSRPAPPRAMTTQDKSGAEVQDAPAPAANAASTPLPTIAHAALPPPSQPGPPRALATQDEHGPEVQHASVAAPPAKVEGNPTPPSPIASPHNTSPAAASTPWTLPHPAAASDVAQAQGPGLASADAIGGVPGERAVEVGPTQTTVAGPPDVSGAGDLVEGAAEPVSDRPAPEPGPQRTDASAEKAGPPVGVLVLGQGDEMEIVAVAHPLDANDQMRLRNLAALVLADHGKSLGELRVNGEIIAANLDGDARGRRTR